MESPTEMPMDASLVHPEKSKAELKTGDGKTLVLVDGHSLAYRMHFALERTDMRTHDERPTWAVYGFFNALFTLLKKEKPDAIAVSFDMGRITFRNDLYADYKAHRETMPDAMRLQMDDIRLGIELLGIPIFELDNYEADDVLGTLASQASSEGYRVRILTGDQDAFQLVDDGEDSCCCIEVLLPPRMPREPMKSYNHQAVFEKWGVYPEQVVDFKGLKGDTSDNIPGVPGIGDKTAAKLLSEYGSLDNLYANLDHLPANKLKEKLITYRDQAFMSRQLATIDRQAPIDAPNWLDCHLQVSDTPALLAFWEAREFKAFIRQAAELLAPFGVQGLKPEPGTVQGNAFAVHSQRDASDEDVPAKALFNTLPTEAVSSISASEAHRDEASGTLRVDHEIITTTISLQALVEKIRQSGIFALDVETTGLDVHTVALAGLAISIGNRLEAVSRSTANVLNLKLFPPQFTGLTSKAEGVREATFTAYIPLLQADLQTELDEEQVLSALKPLLEAKDIIKLVHNVKFESNIFRRRGCILGGLVFDTMIASYIEGPERRHGLKSLTQELLGWPMGDITRLIGTGKKSILFSQVPVMEAAAYATCDSWATWELAVYFLRKLQDERQWALFYEVEMPLAMVLATIEWTGVALDCDYLAQLGSTLNDCLKILEQEIWALAGLEFNLNSPKQVGEVLFERLGIASGRKTKSKTAFSTDVKVLEALADEHEIVRKLLEYRQAFKLKSTYIDALPALVNPATGRVHTSFNQAVTATGRLSSSNPNLQNIPIRSEIGRKIREAFVPEKKEGWSLISADYSQIELRLLAHFSEDPHLLKAFNDGEDIHTATASLVFGLPIEQVSKEQRYCAKTVNFGVIYGQSPFGLAQQLKIPLGEAAQFIRLYFSRYGKVEGYINSIKAQAHQTGIVETLAGRVRNLARDLGSNNRSIREFAERAAFNTPLQGSAADLMKIAMIRLEKRLRDEKLDARIILQVHDELVLEVPDHENQQVTDLIRWAMELGQPLRVPLLVDVHSGPSWIE
jgi:DNA polymerase-1